MLRAKALVGAWELCPQKFTTFFMKMCYFVTVFKNDIAIFAFIAYKCSVWNGRKSIWRQKSGRVSNIACPFGTKSVWMLPNRLHCQ